MPSKKERITVLEQQFERLTAVVEQLTAALTLHNNATTDAINALERRVADLDDPLRRPVAFPTGGSVSAEVAAEAVPEAELSPVEPRRGDRVRLEGAYSLGGWHVPDGWYDVIGADVGVFQIAVPTETTAALPWLARAHPSVKEVRRPVAPTTTPEPGE